MSEKVAELKRRAAGAIDGVAEKLVKLSHSIHSNPELGFEEFRAAGFICGLLEGEGFKVQKGYKGVETSFRADAGSGRPRVAILAEYDALNCIGHGCGHNVIASCAVGAFLGAAKAVGDLEGSVCIIGTPAEEGGGGKVVLLEKGGFDDVDYSIMMHPTAGKSLTGRPARAAVGVSAEFFGKDAHSSDPSRGINALNAVLLLFREIDLVRPTLPLGANVNGIITNGGAASNIIPGYAKCAFTVRANTLQDLKTITDVLKRIIKASALAVGAQPKVAIEAPYAERYHSLPIGEAFKANMESLGEELSRPEPNKQFGSSDMGNVSIVMPAIHDYLWIAEAGVNGHSKDFMEASVSPRADEVCVKGAKGLAMTAIDILADKKLRDEADARHREQVPEDYRKSQSSLCREIQDTEL